MALTVIKPSGIDASDNYTFNGVNVSANASIANLTITNRSNLGAVGNIYIGGGTNGQYLQTDGSGVLSWTTITVSSASISNGNSNVNIPSANGNVNISAGGNTTLVVTGTGANITGTANISGDLTAANANLGNAASANYFIGNFYGTANSATTATTSGTVTTAAQPNITSVGTLSSLSVSGTGSFGGNVNLNSFNITNLATPVASTDAATKQYVDDVAQGLNVHDAAAAATNDTLANITSGTITYNNGSSGVGANLTTTGSFNLIDGVNVQTSGTRILVKNEANAVLNGIYTWSNATVITRATDYNSVPEVEAGDFVFVTGGTLYDNTGWVQTSTVSAIGTAGNNIEFTQFSGAGTYQAGTGLTLTGTTFSVNANQSQVTNVGTLGNLTVSGNATVGNLITSGSGGSISNANVISANTFIASGNITAGNASLGNSVTANYFTGTFYGTANSATTAGTVTTAAQPNITSVGTLSGLTSTGTINFTGASNTSLGPVANVHITGGSSGQYLQTDGSGTLSWATVATGSATISNGNSNVNIPSANGNVNISAVGNANILVVTGTGINVAGTLNVTGNATVGNLITSGSGGNISNANVISANTFIASGNITANNFTTSGSGGNITGGNVISANTFTASGNITAANANLGNAASANYFIGNFYGTANSATTAGTVTTAAQPNITSVGTLTSIIVSGTSNLGPVGNVTITGGTSGQYLQTDGSGVLTWSTVATGSSSNISNGNSNVNIPSANGNINFTAVGNTTMVITGTGVNIAGTLNTTGNTTVGNLFSSGSGGNISNVNVISANTFIASGNITAGNIVTSGAGGNISNANVISANTFTASGNITAGNANLGNSVSANYFIGNFYGTANSATTAGTVTTAAQPNITSVGTLSGLTSTGTINFTGASNTSLGPVGNVHITGGTTGQYLQTDGSGTLSWSTISVSSASISNGNSNVNIPSANGNVNISAEGNANVLVVTGTGVNIAGTLNATGNTTVGNLISSGSGGNISNANVISANTLTASGTINGADLSLSGNGVFGGNLTVNGTLTYINSTTLSISDPIINLQTGANGAAPTSNSGKDVGTALNYYDTSAKIAWMGWDVSNAEIAFGSNVSISSEVVTFTSLANIRSGNASLGNTVTANYFIGSGNNLSNIQGSNVTGDVASATTSGTVTTAAQPNITSVGTLSSLTVSGATNLGAVGNITITGGSNGYVLSTDGSGNLSWISASGVSSNIVVDAFTGNGVQTVFALSSTPTSEDYTIVNIDGVSQLHSAYTVSGANLTLSSAPAIGADIEVMIFNLAGGGGGGGGSNIANGTSNVSIATSNGNITASVSGNANVVVVTGTGVNVAGTIAGTQLTSNIATGTAPLVVTSTTQVANLNVATAGLATYATTANAVAGANVSGEVSFAATANAVAGANVSGTVANATYATSSGSATTAGTVTTAAQPNITSVGTIANLTATNVNFTAFKETVVAGGSVSGTLTPNVAAGTIYNYTLTGNITINALGNAVAGSSAVLILAQDATGGRTLTSTMKFAGNSKTLSTTGSSIDIVSVFYDGTTYYATLSKGYV